MKTDIKESIVWQNSLFLSCCLFELWKCSFSRTLDFLAEVKCFIEHWAAFSLFTQFWYLLMHQEGLHIQVYSYVISVYMHAHSLHGKSKSKFFLCGLWSLSPQHCSVPALSSKPKRRQGWCLSQHSLLSEDRDSSSRICMAAHRTTVPGDLTVLLAPTGTAWTWCTNTQAKHSVT